MTKGRIDFDEVAWGEMKETSREIGGSIADLVRRSIGLYRWALDKRSRGYTIAAIDLEGNASVLTDDLFTPIKAKDGA